MVLQHCWGVLVGEARILNRSEVLPFPIADRVEANEAIRLKYRYLDLRRPGLRENIRTRIQFVREIRRALDETDFLDIETPVLYKSTPEGAREFIVPSRIHPGQFYALPQSPQLFKQILMVAGFERYYQIVRCFRDEDLRADRQPEFTQVDCELSFVDQDGVMEVFQQIIARAVGATKNTTIDPEFPRMTYSQAMEEYGNDKPDTRFDLKLINVSDLVQDCGFKVFDGAISTGGIVNLLRVEGGASLTRKELDEMTEYIRQFGARGMAWAKIKGGRGQASWQSPFAKFLQDETIDAIADRAGAREGDILLFGAGDYKTTKASLAELRLYLGDKLNLYDRQALNFIWITEFPLLEKDDRGRLVACHHPFTSPLDEDLHLMESDPAAMRAAAYDLVLNGHEVGGGSIRIHDPEIQARLFKAIGLSDEEAEAKFGFLLQALKFGAPPHGGIAFGLDRLVMVLAGEPSLREVIVFPKTNKGACLMTGSPTPVTPDELRDLHIRIQSLNLENQEK